MINGMIDDVLESLPEDYSKEEAKSLTYDDICDYILDYFECLYLELIAEGVVENFKNLDDYY